MFDLIGILYSPGEFIRRRLSKPLGYKFPFGIVLVAALAGMLANLMAGEKWFGRLMEQMPANAPEGTEASLKMVKVGFILQDVFGALEPPLMWVLGAGILTCMSILLEGEGEFRKLLELTGYTYLAPMLFGLVAILFATTWTPRFEISSPDPKARPEIFRERVAVAIRGEVQATNFKFLTLLKWASIGWMAVMQVMALKATSKLSYPKSVACFAVFGLLYFISQVVRSAMSAGGI